MKHYNSLCEILNALYHIGYTEHFYKQDGQIFLAGKIVHNIQAWLHCEWHDPSTDETIWVNCCISPCGKKGVFID